MEIKKTPEADLEKEKITFFLVSFAVVLSCFFVLLEWKSSENDFGNIAAFKPVFIENEFVGAFQEENLVPEKLPETVEPEIIYEDFVVSDDIQLAESLEEILFVANELDHDDEELVKLLDEKIVPVEEEVNTDEIITSAEIMPQFPGGQIALARYIFENTLYPSEALKQKIEGRVWCSFVVEADGWVSNIRIEEGINEYLNNEAIRALNGMPPWIPGKTNGEKVPVKIYIPIVFKR